MMKRISILFIMLSAIYMSAETFPVPCGDFAPRCYTAFRSGETIVIDGNLEEASWQLAPWTEDFVDIEGEIKPRPFHQTRVKMLWDEAWLYIAAEMAEPNIWAKLKERDAVIFHDNDFEVFIDPDGDTHDYYELEINALGTLWDLFLIKPYRDRQQVAVNAWDIRDIEYVISIVGTLNDPSDIDKMWIVEMKIPMETLKECAHKPVPPPEGDFWRVNFSRVHWDTSVQKSAYQKIAGKPEYNWVWSPQGLIAMHYPERWGYLFFSHDDVGSKRQYQIPASELDKEYLRQLYYKQKQYWMDHKRYAKSLKKLKAKPYLLQGKKQALAFETTSQSYIITLKTVNGTFCIREDGLIYLK